MVRERDREMIKLGEERGSQIGEPLESTANKVVGDVERPDTVDVLIQRLQIYGE